MIVYLPVMMSAERKNRPVGDMIGGGGYMAKMKLGLENHWQELKLALFPGVLQ